MNEAAPECTQWTPVWIQLGAARVLIVTGSQEREQKATRCAKDTHTTCRICEIT